MKINFLHHLTGFRFEMIFSARSFMWFLLWMLLPLWIYAETIWQAQIQKPFAITLKVNAQEMHLDDTLNLEAEFHYPASYQLDTRVLQDQLLATVNPLAPQWSLLQFTPSDLPAEEGEQGLRLSVKVAPLMTGSADISFLTVTFLPKEAAQSPVRASTPIFSIKILQSSPSTTPFSLASLIPLEPQFPLELTQTNRQLWIDNPKRLQESKQSIQNDLEAHSFPWLTMAILLGCGGLGWTLYLVRDRWHKQVVKSVAAPSGRQQIDQALQFLNSRYSGQEQTSSYYAGLASLLLDALQARLGWKTRELTTAELAQTMKTSSSLSSQQKEEALSFLAEMDQVKFGGKKPSQVEAMQISQQVQMFIHDLFSSK